MGVLPSDDVLQIALTLWSFLGEHMYHTSNKIKLFRMFNIAAMASVIFFIFANLKVVKGALYIKTMESAITVIHTLIKYCLFSYHKQDIGEIILDRLKFWKPKDFPDHLCKNAFKVFYFTKTVQKIIIVVFIITLEMYCFKPIFGNNNRFILQAWPIYDSIALETIVLGFQYYFLCIVIPIVAGYDAIYFSFCSHLVVQLRFLKYRMVTMRPDEDVLVLHECIQHHQLISSIFNRMKRIYAWMLLFHYLVTLTTACSQLYLIMLRTSGIWETITTIIYIFNLFAEFGCYTFPVEEVVFEFTDLANAIYMSPWIDVTESSKKSLSIMMTKTQQQKYFSGGGMIEINLNALGSVARKAFSFYAILKNVV